jgi:hypothetical protein
MKFYKGFSTTAKPFIIFNEWQQDDDDALILREDELPLIESGVYPVKIEGGVYVSRTPTEKNAYRDEWIERTFLDAQKTKINDLNNGTFVYDTKTFPMDERSRAFYTAIDRIRGNQKLMTSSGILYDLIDSASNIDDFMTAYFNAVKTITQPDV